MNRIIFILFVPFLFSCTTVDVEKNVRSYEAGRFDDSGVPTADLPLVLISDPEIVVVERPVFIPQAEAQGNRAPATGQAAVRESNAAGIILPKDYSHAAMVYDYNPDWVYEIYAQPLRVCDITLQPGERAVEPPFVSDSERWILGGGISYEGGLQIQHIYVKPSAAGLEASLIINTDRRVYRIILRSYAAVHMPVTRWRYLSGLPNNFSFSGSRTEDDESENSFLNVDPRLLSFNYTIRHGVFNRPYWRPSLVFDDGSKTYITFPETVLQREMPAVFENRRDILNYRVMGNMVVIDKLIENITVRIGGTEITITKKKGA